MPLRFGGMKHKSSVGNRGERLKIIDPGIVPQRSSSPKLTLNVFAAILIALSLHCSMSASASSPSREVQLTRTASHIADPMFNSARFVALIAVYSASVALAPNPGWALALIAPLIAFPILWWTLSGAHRWLALFFVTALLLPPLPIAIGNSGPHPAITLAALGPFIGFLRVREWRISINLLSFSIVFFFCVLLISIGFAAIYSGGSIAAGVLARVGLFGISVYAFFYTAYGPDAESSASIRSVRLLFLAATVVALFACFDFYFQLPAPAGYGPQFVWLDTGVYRRAQGLFYEASTLGNFCMFFLVMIAVALFQPVARRRLSRMWLLAGGVILSAALIFSYSRASLLNLAVSIACLPISEGFG